MILRGDPSIGLIAPGLQQPLTPANIAVPDGLDAFFPFTPESADFANNKVYDLTYRRSIATLSGSTKPTPTAGNFGGYALSFNGSSTVCQSANGSENCHGTITMAAWFKTNSTAQVKFIMCMGQEVNGKRRGILQRNANIDFNGQQWDVSSSGNRLNTTEWFHVVITLSNPFSSPSCQIWVNGVIQSTGGFVGVASAADFTGTTINIGSNNAGGEIINATIGEVRVYSRALSPDEILALYYSGLMGHRSAVPRLDNAVWLTGFMPPASVIAREVYLNQAAKRAAFF